MDVFISKNLYIFVENSIDMINAKKIFEGNVLDFYSVPDSASFETHYFEARVSAGFPSPADDYSDVKLDLNQALVSNPSSTFYVRVKGSSMIDAGINDGDMLVIDRSITPGNNNIAVCVINGEFTVKRLHKENGKMYLMPENKDFKPIEINEDMDFMVWGVVTFVIHKV